MLDPVGDYFDGQSFGVADGLLARLPVGHHAREFKGLGNPATVIFPIDLDGKVHPSILSRQMATALGHPVSLRNSHSLYFLSSS
jgi:hypothetical protein